jgi:hypothetical protein
VKTKACGAVRKVKFKGGLSAKHRNEALCQNEHSSLVRRSILSMFVADFSEHDGYLLGAFGLGQV